MKQFNIITVYPDFFESFKNHGLIKKGLLKKLIEINILNIRNFTDDKHKRVDFKPYGGGPGMIIQYCPVKKAIDSLNQGKTIMLSPQGERLTQKKLACLSNESNLNFICGRYEGVDQRIIDNLVDEEISIGDYVLSGGEIPAAAVIEGIVRLIPDIAENMSSIENDSFSNKLLEYPQYTKPNLVDGLSVPDVLISGNHREVERWRRKAFFGCHNA